MARAFANDGTLVTWQSMQAERDKLRENLTLEVKNATRLAAEGDQLRARVAGLEASNHRQGIGSPRHARQTRPWHSIELSR